MSDGDENLRQSLESYEIQLTQIQQALTVATDEQRIELEQIEKDLQEIIELTRSSLTTTSEESSSQTSQNPLENELRQLEGLKCQVPFQYAWGGVGYHNAIVLSAEADEEGSVYIQVVFMHPTSKKMQPCPYFLEDKCKYSDEKCHYSHGYTAALNTVRDYEEPDYSLIGEGSSVLAKYKDDLWYRARVENTVSETEFSVKFDHCDDTLVLDFHSIYPTDDDSDSEDSEDDDDEPFVPRDMEDDGLSSSERASQVNNTFGHWEKHTRGIGSKLMAKMGYVYGSGLGVTGEGRTEPVKAVVFPPGRSLDRCMELREKAGNEDVLTVERRLERQKRKEEHRQQQMASAAPRHSVFDFINSKLAKQSEKEVSEQPTVSRSRQKMADLKNVSGQTLNVQSFQLGESIRRTEREMADLKRSVQRHSDRGDTITASQMQSRLNDKQQQLERLRATEKSVADEQKQRKRSNKLAIF